MPFFSGTFHAARPADGGADVAGAGPGAVEGAREEFVECAGAAGAGVAGA
jgi:hypothetical protein